MGWVVSRMRVVRAGGAFGRKPFREAGSPGAREGVRAVRCALTASVRAHIDVLREPIRKVGKRPYAEYEAAVFNFLVANSELRR